MNEFEEIESDSLDLQFNPETGTYRTSYDWERKESLSTTLLVSVEAITDLSPTDLPPLYEYVDPDALHSLFEPRAETAHNRDAGSITFPYAGFFVTVHADGVITLRGSERIAENNQICHVP